MKFSLCSTCFRKPRSNDGSQIAIGLLIRLIRSCYNVSYCEVGAAADDTDLEFHRTDSLFAVTVRGMHHDRS